LPATADAAADRELADAVLTARLLCDLGPLGGVTCRRIGGLRALYHPDCGADAPFGLLRGGEVFLKAGPDTVTKYIARGMWAFRSLQSRPPLRGYWRVPPEVLDDPSDVRRWAAWAIDAARQFGPRPRRSATAPLGGVLPKRRRAGGRRPSGPPQPPRDDPAAGTAGPLRRA